MKEIVVIDSKIPFIAGVFEPWCRVIYSDHITHEQAHAARVLVVRTRTQCNGELLRGSSVGFIATATIGTDHIDLDYCHDHGIVVQSAAGCNARAVAQWVFAALRSLGIKGGTLGIVGVGNVGRQVMAMAQQRGFSLLLNDPPRADSGESGFVELDYLLRHSDVVTLHTPLTLSTRALASEHFFAQMASGAVFLNSSRGEVVSEPALLCSPISLMAIDVWCNEPYINIPLLERATISTPHIAGYSARGKARATQMSVRAVAHWLGIEALSDFSIADGYELESADSYDILADTLQLKSHPELFEELRGGYAYR